MEVQLLEVFVKKVIDLWWMISWMLYYNEWKFIILILNLLCGISPLRFNFILNW